MKKIFFFSLILFSILFLANAFNAIPIADDYYNHNFTNNLGAIGFANHFYLTWSGRFLTILFIGLTNKILPIEHLNIASLLLALGFLTFLYQSSKVMVQDSIDRINKYVVMASLLVITWFTYRQVLGRVVIWFSGGMVYMFWYVLIPFFFLEFIKCFENKVYSLKLLILSILLANSIETVPPALIFFMASYLIVKKVFFHKESFKYFFSLAFIISVASLPLLLAPGNFVRAKTISVHNTHTVLGLLASYFDVAKVFLDCAANTLFLTIPMALICASFLGVSSKTKRLQIGFCLIASAIGSALPMGFASEHNGARPASLFVLFTCFGLFSVLSTIFIFPKIEKHKQTFSSILLILASVFVAFDFYRGLAMRDFFVARDKALKSSQYIDKEVVVTVFPGKTPRSQNNHDIKNDKNNWMNVSVAEYYKLKSIRLAK